MRSQSTSLRVGVRKSRYVTSEVDFRKRSLTSDQFFTDFVPRSKAPCRGASSALQTDDLMVGFGSR